jgi:cob(I)alamin adenosyltransferase
VPRLTKIYTRTGDDGTTALGFGGRVAKDSLRVECYGTVDELNSALGLARASDLPAELDRPLATIQNELFHLGSDLCVPENEKDRHPVPRIEARHVAGLEALIDGWNGRLAPLDNFVLPGGTAGAAALHLARTVCRRAERLLVRLGRDEAIGEHALGYLNRLSDALFVLARAANALAGEPDVLWDSRA